MKKIFIIALGLVAILVVVPFAYNNNQVIRVNYMSYSIDWPVAYLIIGAFISGVVLTLIFFAIAGLGWKLRAKSLKKKVDELLVQRKREEIAEKFKAEQKAGKITEKVS